MGLYRHCAAAQSINTTETGTYLRLRLLSLQRFLEVLLEERSSRAHGDVACGHPLQTNHLQEGGRGEYAQEREVEGGREGREGAGEAGAKCAAIIFAFRRTTSGDACFCRSSRL